jgi:hypothetical protein
MTRKSGYRFLDKIMRKRIIMTRKSVQRFFGKVMPKIKEA